MNLEDPAQLPLISLFKIKEKTKTKRSTRFTFFFYTLFRGESLYVIYERLITKVSILA